MSNPPNNESFQVANAPADVTATDGNPLGVQWHPSGIYTLA
jgi:hypothetical protein